MSNQTGTAGNDQITGTADEDFIDGNSGADLLLGGDGPDTLNGAWGNDSLDGGDGNDTIVFSPGSDQIMGGNGFDTVTVAAPISDFTFSRYGYSPAVGNFTLSFYGTIGSSGFGSAQIQGVEQVIFTDATVTLRTGTDSGELFTAGDNPVLVINAEGGADTIIGGNFKDLIGAGLGSDSVFAGGGNDEIVIGIPENDTVDGGDGYDTVIIGVPEGDAVIIASGDLVSLSGGGSVTLANVERLDVFGASGNDLIIGSDREEFLQGMYGDDTLRGGSGNDSLDGYYGDDSLDGGAGDDVLNGNFGNDTLDGGAGNDTASFSSSSSSGVTLVRLGETSFSVVHANGTGTLHNVEFLQLADTRINLLTYGMVSGGGTTGDDNLSGDVGNNLIQGVDGNDTILGLDGNDTLEGGAGNDSLDGGSGSDSVLGGNGDDTIIASAGNDTLDGGSGYDTVNYSVASSGMSIQRNYFLADEGWFSALTIMGLVGNTYEYKSLIDIERVNFTDRTLNMVGWTTGDDTVILADTGAQLHAVNLYAGNDTLTGSSGNDLIGAGLGADSIMAGAGDDYIMAGRPEGDVIDGGAGYDTLEVGYSNSTGAVTMIINSGSITDNSGGSLTYSNIESVQVMGSYQYANTLSGGETRDSLYGGVQADFLFGGLGNDSLWGSSGNDTLDGSMGNDTLDGGAGDDTLNGGDGIDTVTLYSGTVENTTIVSNGSGSFTVTLSGSTDTLYNMEYLQLSNTLIDLTTYGSGTGSGSGSTSGTTGDDSLTGGAGSDLLLGGSGNDTLSGGPGNDTLEGGVGDDSLDGGVGDDSLAGGNGNDTLVASAGYDTLDGGSGYDIVQYMSAAFTGLSVTRNNYNASEGVFYAVNTAGTVNGVYEYKQFFDVEQINFTDRTLYLVNYTTGAENIDLSTGAVDRYAINLGAGNDTLTGSINDDLIGAGLGADSIMAGGGNDFILAGRPEDDIIDGGAGYDVLEIGYENSTGSILVVVGSSGITDNVGGTLSFSNIEGIQIAGSFSGSNTISGGIGDETIRGGFLADYIFGNTGNDSLFGSSGDDTLSGAAGNDTLDGGAGNDTLDGGDGIDTVYFFSGNTGNATIVKNGDGSFSVTLSGSTDTLYNAEYLQLNGTTIDLTTYGSGTGTTGDDDLTGGTGNDRLFGGDGNDTLFGGSGNDTLSGGNGDDRLIVSQGFDLVYGGSGTDVLVIPGSMSGFAVERYNYNLADDGSFSNISISGSYSGSYVYTLAFEVEGLSFSDGAMVWRTGTNTGDLIIADTGTGLIVNAGSGADTIVGSNLHDIIGAGADADSIAAGDGNDSIMLGRPNDDTVDGGAGIDTVEIGYSATTGLTITIGDSQISDNSGGLATLNDIERISVRVAGRDTTITGSSRDEYLESATGNDILLGNDGNDTLRGGSGDDSLVGGAGSDYLYGGTGNDTLDGGSGYDTVSFYPFSSTGVTITRVDANSLTITHGGNTSLLRNVESLSLADTFIDLTTYGNDTGPTGDDLLTGTTGADSIVGGAGNDTILGLDGNDTLNGGIGNDNLDGGAGNDNLSGGSGDDTIIASSGFDTIDGGSGFDIVAHDVASTGLTFSRNHWYASEGRFDAVTIESLFSGGNSAETLYNIEQAIFIDRTLHITNYTTGADSLTLSDTGLYAVNLGGGNDTLTGSSNDDLIGAGLGADSIVAGAGNDFIMAGRPEGDYIDGGAGYDTLEIGYSNVTGVTNVSISDLIISDGYGGKLTFSNIEGIRVTADYATAINITGSLLDEEVWGSNQADLMVGNGGDDNLFGASGNDSLYGGDGNDTLNGDYGDDLLNGGSGNDIAYIYATGATITKNQDGSFTVVGNGATDTLINIETLVLNGQNIDLTTYGLTGETLNGGTGNDFLTGGTGADLIIGFAGDDNVYAGDGNDTVQGGDGLDTLFGGLGADSLQGGSGDDYLGGDDPGISGSNDTLDGGEGYDIASYNVENATDPVTFIVAPNTGGTTQQNDGLGGTDTLIGIEEVHVLGGSGGDLIIGNDSRNYFEGRGGNDKLTGGGGDDTFSFLVDAPVGVDYISDLSIGDNINFYQSTGAVTLNTVIQAGDDKSGIALGEVRVAASSGGYSTLFVNAGGGAGIVTIQLAGYVEAGDLRVDHWNSTASISLTGGSSGASAGNDTLVGVAGGNFIVGMAGDDSILGGAESDNLFGDRHLFNNNNLRGDGNDTIFGYGGADFIRGGGGADLIDGGDSDDVLYGSYSSSPVSAALDGADTLIGGAGDDVLRGNHGDDSLLGGAGDDNLRGDAGSDTLDGGDGFDFVSYYYDGVDLTGGVNVNLNAFTPGETYTFVDAFGGTDTLIGIERIGLGGTQFADTITGSAFDDQVAGGDGNDSIDGGSGNDYLVGDAGEDTLRGGAGNDTLIGAEDNDLLDGGDGYDLASFDFTAGTGAISFTASGLVSGSGVIHGDTLIGIEAVEVWGTSFDDTIHGSAGNDIIDAGAGNDVIDGGAGRDTAYIYATGNTSIVRNNNGSFTITNDGFTDTLLSVETLVLNGETIDLTTYGGSGAGDQNLTGTSGGDQLNGGAGNDLILGLGGNDNISGFAGNDTLDGGDGDDYLFGNAGDDSLVGGIGNDYLRGDDAGNSGGNDTLVGGLGSDVAAYSFEGSSTAVNFTVVTNTGGTVTQSDGLGGTDTLIGIEYVHVLGSDVADTFVGNDGENYIEGRGGDDTLTGGGGNDNFAYRVDVAVGVDRITDFSVGDGINFYLPSGTVALGTTIQTGSDSSGMVLGDVRVGATSGGYTTLYVYAGGTAGLVEIQIAGSLAASDLQVGHWGNSAGIYLIGGTPGASPGNDTLVGTSGSFSPIAGLGGDDQITGTQDGDSLFGGSLSNNNNNLTADGNDTILGLGGDDIIRGGGGSDYIDGGDGNDALYGSNNSSPVSAALDGADTLIGGAGDDVLRGNNGDDSLLGGAGNDNLRGDAGNDTLDGGDGIDFVSYYYGGITQSGAVSIDISDFTPGASYTFTDAFGGTDTLIGIERLGISGSQFADTITGSAYDDQLNGSAGNDSIIGGAGNDYITGDDGDGDTGVDTLRGGDGDDTLVGGLGNDLLDGGAGFDFAVYEFYASASGINFSATGLSGGSGILLGQTLVDVEAVMVTGSSGHDTITGSAGHDVLSGGEGNDLLFGGAGNDTFSFDGYYSAPNGIDTIADFGDGDTILVNGAMLSGITSGGATGIPFGGVHIQAGASGTTLVHVGLGGTGAADLTIVLNGTHTASEFIIVDGNRLALAAGIPQSLTGTTGADTMVGGNQNDTILGLAGDDVLAGLGGSDSLQGGDGNDVLAGYSGGEGNSVGDGADTLDGGSGTDTLIGFDGDDLLLGGDGNDQLRGDAGNDTLDGGAGNDVASYRFDNLGLTGGIFFDAGGLTGDGVTIADGRGGTDTLSGIESIIVVGSNFADTLSGSAGGDQITGGSGNDFIQGGAGDDFYLEGGVGNDTIDGGAGSADAAVYDLSVMTTGVKFDGGAFAQTAPATLADGRGGIDTLMNIEVLKISGGSGNDLLIGSTLVDHLAGGMGADTLIGGAGNDVFIFAGEQGVDRIRDLEAGDSILVLGRDFTGISDVTNTGGSLLANQVGVMSLGNNATRLFIGINDVAGADLMIDLDGSFTAADFTLSGGRITASYAAAYSTGDGTANTLTGRGLNDSLNGAGGNDTLLGAGGSDTLLGGEGDDLLFGGADTGSLSTVPDLGDSLDGGAGNDLLHGGDGADTLLGSDGNDHLRGDAGNDLLDGGSGSDTISYRFDDLGLTGGVSFSLAEIISGNSGTVGDGRGGTDTLLNFETISVTGSNFADTFTGSALGDEISGMSGADLIAGGSGNDTLSGGEGNDTISGDAGNDMIAGDGGSDSLLGGDGDDTLAGGAGTDTLDGGSGNDTAYYDLSEGATGGVQLRVSGNFVQVNNSVTDTLRLIERIEVRGSSFADTIQGGLGNETIAGMSGNDSLSGGGGNDTFLYFAADPSNTGALLAQGVDRIVDFAPGDRITVQGLTFGSGTVSSGNGAGVQSGVVQSEIVNGVTRIHIGLDSNAGADLMIELGTAVEAANLRLSGSDIVSSANLLLTGTANAEYLAGGDGDDTINGFGGNDFLVGGAGNDSLNGGDGQDQLDGSVGNDTLNGGSGDDTVQVGQALADGYTIARNGDGSISLTTSAYGTDTLIDVEGLSFSDAYVRLTVASFVGPGGTSYDGTDAFGDSIAGGTGNDYLNGRDGNDTLVGAAGGDYFFGGKGNDVIQGGDDGVQQGNVLVDVARYEGNFASYTITQSMVGNVLTFTITDDQPAVDGDDGTDVLTGIEALSFKDDGFVRLVPQIYTNQDGSTYVEGTRFADDLTGSANRDNFNPGLGADTVDGGAGDDNVFYNVTMSSVVVAASGADFTITIGGATSLLKNIESVNFQDGYLRLTPYVSTDASGNSFIDGTDFAETLTGGTGNDYIRGNAGADNLSGGAGGDYLEGGSGNDTIDGGANGTTVDNYVLIDVARYNGNFADYTITRNGGTVTVTDDNPTDGDDGTDTLTNVEVLGFKDDGYVRIVAQTVTNTDGSLYIEGTRYNDNLEGVASNDYFRPGLGVDTIDGKDGNDTVGLDFAYNQANLTQSGGSWVYSQGGNVYTLTNVEALSFTDQYLRLAPAVYSGTDGNKSVNGTDFSDNLSGLAGTGNDYIDGGSGNDTIDGAAGGDYLYGGAGNDVIDGGAEGTGSGGEIYIDVARFNGNMADYTITRSGGTVTVTDTLDGSEGTDALTNVEGLSFNDVFVRIAAQTFISSDNLTAYTEGTQFDDNLTGSSRADYFDGRGGADTIDGGDGDDTVRVDANLSAVVINDTADGFTVTVGSTVLTLSNIEGLSFNDTYARLTTFVSSDGRTHIGTEVLGDTITGSSNGDYINGYAGNDVLFGNAGSDVLIGGAGNDTIDGGENASGLDVASYSGAFTDYVIAANGGTITITDSNAADGNEGTDTLTTIEALQFSDRFVRVAVERVATNLSASGEYVYGTVLGEVIAGTSDGDGILGREGNDTINAGSGDDYIDAGLGDDLIDGGAGNDVFRWVTGDGNDTISGFEAGDILSINSVVNASDVAFNIVGSNTVITVGTATLTLLGYTALLTDDNFGAG